METVVGVGRSVDLFVISYFLLQTLAYCTCCYWYFMAASVSLTLWFLSLISSYDFLCLPRCPCIWCESGDSAPWGGIDWRRRHGPYLLSNQGHRGCHILLASRRNNVPGQKDPIFPVGRATGPCREGAQCWQVLLYSWQQPCSHPQQMDYSHCEK